MAEAEIQQTDDAAPVAPLTLPISAQRLLLFLTVILFRLIMDYSYVTYLSPEEVVENNFSNFLEPQKLHESWILMLACAAFLPVYMRKPSDFLLYILFIFPCMATISFFAYLDGSRIYAYAVALSFIIIASTRNIKFTLPNFQIRAGDKWALSAGVILVALVGIAYFNVLGTAKFQLNLMDVYSVRQKISNALASARLLAYVGTWTWTVITVFLIAWSVRYKKWIYLALLLAIQVYFFGMTSAKAVLFYPLLVFIAYWFAQPNKRLIWLLYSVILMVCIGIAEEMILGSYLWNHVLVRRVLWDAGRLNWSYYELYSKIGHVYMSDSVLRHVIGYPFKLPPQYMVGLFAYSHPDANADTGFLGTAYMHFGPAGLIAFSLIVGLLLRITDVLTHGRVPVWMGTAIVIGPYYALFNDSDLTTALLTHGLALALLVLFLYGRFSERKNTFLARGVPSTRTENRARLRDNSI